MASSNNSTCGTATPTYMDSTSSCSDYFTITRTRTVSTTSTSPTVPSNSSTIRRTWYHTTSRTSNSSAKSEKLRTLAKKIIKDLRTSQLKASWNENNVPNLKENPQPKQPMWLNHKINSDRGR